MGERDLVLQCLGRCVAIYMGCGLCDGYDFICRVFCRFIDTDVTMNSILPLLRFEVRRVLALAGRITGNATSAAVISRT
jgi:hypothetical protein